MRRPRASAPRRLAGCLAALGVALAALGGCSPLLERVQPWEREELAGDLMRPDFNPAQERDWEHVYFSKEATPGTSSSGGGGCGCN